MSLTNTTHSSAVDTMVEALSEPILEEDCFQFTAIQIVNHFLEVFDSTSSRRIEDIAEIFADDGWIGSLKSNKQYMKGREAIAASFNRTKGGGGTTGCFARVYVPPLPSDGAGNGNSPSVSFVLDFHKPGTSPGLGDPNKNGVLLYRCTSKHITHVWGGVDTSNVSSTTPLLLSTVTMAAAWDWATSIIRLDLPLFGENPSDFYFHDYSSIETWG